MTATTISNYDQIESAFKGLNVDDQLGLLWFIYTKMGTSVTPAAPGAAGSEIAEGLLNQVKALSFPEQLQVQRDIASKANTEISREYGSLSANTKLAFWFFLAQGMENGTIIPMPPDYQLPQGANNLLIEIEALSFNQQIEFLRNAALDMGAEPPTGAGI